MSLIKTKKEIASLKAGGKILSDILRELRELCVAGANTADLDRLARQRMEEAGGAPSFLNYKISKHDPGFPGAVCTSLNHEVVHGLPIPGREIKDGDIVGLDIGMWYEGLCTDMATTVMVGSVPDQVRELVERTRASLVKGLEAIRPGGAVGDIGAAIEDYITPFEYGIVRDLVGHGVGHAVHEDPQVPNYRDTFAMKHMLRPGMVLAIEPMITLGSGEVVLEKDQWTISTSDKSLSAHFEVTITVTEDGYELVTPWPDTESPS